MSWLVTQLEEEPELLAALEASPNPEAGELSYVMTRSTDGLIHLFEAGRRNWLFGCNESERKRLSSGRGVWFCMLEEHTMTSECCFWEEGVEKWSVYHNPELGGVFHLEERGTLPVFYGEIRDRVFEEQIAEGGEECGVDLVIAVPMELSKQITGYDGGYDGVEGETIELYSKIIPPEPNISIRAHIVMNTLAAISRVLDVLRKR